jgi:pyruvate dehydrogenase E2 component (dihydrolipoamide acetyltransferase)
MNNGRLAKWLKKPGDKVKSGEAIAEVETDKAIMEVEAFHDGYLAGPLAAIDSEFPVGQTIGYIADNAAEAVAPASVPAAQPTVSATTKSAVNAPAVPSPAATASPLAATAQASPPSAPDDHPTSPIVAAAAAYRPRERQFSPAARALAHQAGTDSAQAPQQPAISLGMPAPGAQTEAAKLPPVERQALEAGPSYRIERASSLREAVARNMIASAGTPTFHVTAQIPLGALIAKASENKVSLTLLLARACALTITAHPLFNTAYTPDGLAHRDRIDIGIAVDSLEGLITPVLRDVSGRSLAELANDWGALRDKVKSRRLVPTDYRGATFYLSDLGVFPVVYAFDSIVPVGASAILSVAVARKEGAIFTLSCDHRVVFGGDAARFLQTLSEWLSDPAKLMEKDKTK